ncbi:MAG TPA: hypothetical protein VM513_28795 [Kofleriaceae bacterium]|jgi:hypothetical protein|nr:hypothetical protein [Kofleriaceae bacterium]
MMKNAGLLALLVLAGCEDEGRTLPDGLTPDASPDARTDQPMLMCTPASAPDQDLCSCMANIVCDQVYACLTPAQLAAKPAAWSPKASCVSALVSDCEEDLESDPVDSFPADFRACIADLGAATCSDYGTFTSLANDFPASCANLRALDTALAIGP